MKIAVIGSGISGLTCAYQLHKTHDVHVFESAPRIGGHTATVDVTVDDQTYAVDTGFIVYNDRTYPHFIKMLADLDIATQPSEMSFSVKCAQSGLEYGGAGVNTLFAQRRNLFKPRYWRMLLDIVRFNKQALRDAEKSDFSDTLTLGGYLEQHGFSDLFVSHYLLPMGSAIWSATTADMTDFPAKLFVTFFKNHGLLSVTNRPQWRVLVGGSNQYLAPLSSGYADRIHLNSRIKRVSRDVTGVTLAFENADPMQFDQVIFACHSDQALALLENPSDEETAILGAIPYQNNVVTLHTDTRLLPQAVRAWSSWNYHIDGDTQQPPILTYNMNILQSIQSDRTFLVTLNADHLINPDLILGQFQYAHPQFSTAAYRAQRRWHEINGVNNTWFCGAYWANGFHEDGHVSGLRVAEHLLTGSHS
jgi:predicted NAD/FAD-binding protein